MRRESGESRGEANNLTPGSGKASADDGDDPSFALASENPHEWFFVAARRLLGKDAGYALHKLTGYPASSCYAYVARDPIKRRRPPEHFIRTLIHHQEGGPFLRAFMRGCTAPHWLAIERAERIVAQLDAIDLT